MRITPVPHGIDLGVSTLPRTPGLHMSTCYNDFYCDLEPKRFDRHSAPDPLKLEAGLALESVLEEGLKARMTERPGEFVEPEHGIIYSPDLIIFNGETRLGEIKLTWMSSREVPREEAHSFPEKFSKWFTQMKLYARCLDTPHARLLAFFVNGLYDRGRGGGRPELLAWDILFTKRELDDEWRTIMNHSKRKGLLSS